MDVRENTAILKYPSNNEKYVLLYSILNNRQRTIQKYKSAGYSMMKGVINNELTWTNSSKSFVVK